MIHLTRLGGREFLLNAELIEMVEKTPDSVITMVSGKKYLVKESLEEIQEKFIEYKKKQRSGCSETREV